MNDYKEVKKILNKFLTNKNIKSYIFGSRVKNTHRVDSDLDILLDDKNSTIDPATLIYLEEAFENSNIPFKVDLVLRSRIDKKFYENISKDLRLFDF